MLTSIFYVLLALIGLGFLVFIHELGHYFVAKKVGMRIEVFSIGFGKPIYSWGKKGIKYQIGILPFGGFVKIAGMEKQKGKEPHEIKDGFFGKRPIDRIKVAFSGPFVNFIFAFLAFFIIWIFGGRDQSFAMHTKKIGMVNEKSTLYENEVRPGDEIISYNNKKYTGFKDLLYFSALKRDKNRLKGFKVDYYKDLKVPFDYDLKTYKKKAAYLDSDFYLIGIESPANFLICEKFTKNLLPSGIKKGDRIIWVDGEIIFSKEHLSNVINDNTVFLSLERDGKILFAKIPRVRIGDLEISSYDLEEISDWRYSANIKKKLKNLYFLPYLFNEKGIVESSLKFIDEEEVLYFNKRNPFSINLEKGDRIIAVDGKKSFSATDILFSLQKKYSQIIVKRNSNFSKTISWKESDDEFEKVFRKKDLNKLIQSMEKGLKSVNDLYLLKRVELISLEKLSLILGKNAELSNMLLARKKEIGKIKNPKKRELFLKSFEESKNRLVLGIDLKDKKIKYNPNPLYLFYSSFLDGIRTLKSLISGKLSPKFVMGPVGIVQVVQRSWGLGILESLFWLGVISLNLGFVNLLPIPVLDGGHIVFSVVEMITKKPIKAKTMEKLIIPFIVLLILAFIFITYNDILRWVKGFFN